VELLCNAVKYSPEDGEVRVRAWRTDADVLLLVADEGEGIAPEHLPRLFEPFFQVTAEGDPQQPGGLGLGLTLCRAIASRHGGQIWAESTPGEGTRLWVQLPRATS
jgi:signal transduction histidine kinase